MTDDVQRDEVDFHFANLDDQMDGERPDACEGCGMAGEICWSHAGRMWLCVDCHYAAFRP
jgi:hypothetical protein